MSLRPGEIELYEIQAESDLEYFVARSRKSELAGEERNQFTSVFSSIRTLKSGNLMNFLTPFSSVLLSVLRIMTGLLLLQHGTTKILNYPVGPMNDASPMTLSGVAGILELVGGILLILGLFTRPVAFILSGLLAVAYFYAHAPSGFFPILNGGELAALYSFVLLYIAAAGGGSLSVDRAISSDD